MRTQVPSFAISIVRGSLPSVRELLGVCGLSWVYESLVYYPPRVWELSPVRELPRAEESSGELFIEVCAKSEKPIKRSPRQYCPHRFRCYLPESCLTPARKGQQYFRCFFRFLP